MRLTYLTVLMFAASMCCGCGSSPTWFASDPEELERLKGTWHVVAVEVSGTPADPARLRAVDGRYIFDGERITVKRLGQADMTTTFSVDAAANPKRMIISPHGPAWAIYDSDGTRLRLCIVVDGNTSFPTDFVSRPSPKIDLITMERHRAGAPPAAAPGLPPPAPGVPTPAPAIPGESIYTYAQSTGKLSLNDQLICIGWSGKGAARNNHDKQAEKNGPIPVGEYMLSGFRDDHKLGIKIMSLMPMAGKANVFKRWPKETFAFVADKNVPPLGCFIVVTGEVFEKLVSFNAKLRVVE